MIQQGLHGTIKRQHTYETHEKLSVTNLDNDIDTDYTHITEALQNTAKRSIPRGCRKQSKMEPGTVRNS